MAWPPESLQIGPKQAVRGATGAAGDQGAQGVPGAPGEPGFDSRYITLTAGATIAENQLVALVDDGGSTAMRVKVCTSTDPCIGIAAQAAVSGQTILVQVAGIVTAIAGEDLSAKDGDVVGLGATAGRVYAHVAGPPIGVLYYGPSSAGADCTVILNAGIGSGRAPDGTAALPTYSFDGDTNTGIFRLLSSGNDYLGITAGGVANAFFGDDGNGIFFYENLYAYHMSPNADSTYDLGFISTGKWRDIWFAPSATGTGDDLVVGGTGRIVKKSSSIRYKDNVETLDFDSSKLDGLRPVKYNYKDDIKAGNMQPDIGLIAEEVSEVYPELVQYNEEGNPESVKYHSLSVMLLDEVKQLRKEIKELQETS